jgi:hypothetical protein
MASQTPKAPQKFDNREVKRGLKNPGIYAGSIIVLVIVIVTFVFMPIGTGASSSVIGNGRALRFGTYAGQPIEYSQGSYMAAQVRDLNDRLTQQGLTQENYQLFAYQVYRGAFERSVVRTAAINEVKRSGGSVTEDWLDGKVAENPAYQENGAFSAELYAAATLAEKLRVRDEIRDDTLYQTYFTDVLGVAPSSKEIDFVKGMAKETRTIEYAAFSLSDYPDAEIATWGKAHADLFRSLDLSRITIASSEADAKKLLKNITDKKTTFEDAAKASSKDSYAQKGGAEGPMAYHELSKELSGKDDGAKLLALKTGDLSTVFKTTAGTWVFFKANAAVSEADFSQATVLAAVREYMNGNERGVIEDWSIARAKALTSAGNAGFEAAAKKAGAAVKTLGPFPINYGSVSVSLYGQTMPIFKAVVPEGSTELAGAASNEKFLTTVFSQAPGSVADPLVLGDYVIVVKVKEAGAAKDDDLSGIGYYYPYFAQTKAQDEVRDLFVNSPELKDDFSSIFFKYFQPAAAKKN